MEDVLVEPLRPRLVVQARVEDRLDERIAPRQRVADDEDVRAAGDTFELRGVVSFRQLYAERFELRAHRRIDVRIAARHLEPDALGDRGDASHERAADAEDVDMHRAPYVRGFAVATDAGDTGACRRHPHANQA